MTVTPIFFIGGNKVKVGIKLLNELAKKPSYADNGAAGFDFYSTEKIVIMPMCAVTVGTGVALEIPTGYEIQVRGRSGLAFKHNVYAHVGTIDESYKGEIKVRLFNFSDDPYLIEIGDRIAQGVLAPIKIAEFDDTIKLTSSERGGKGFGDSGK